MSSILVVDDDKTTRHVLSTVLKNAGFSTSVAKDGVEALKALSAGHFELLDAADERPRSPRQAPRR